MKKQIITMCAAVAMASCSNSTMDINKQVDKLYDKMSQEERINQLRSAYMDDLFDENGCLDTAKCHELIPNEIGRASCRERV